MNAHFQNGVAERRIRELQDHARTMLIQANRRWPTAIDTHLLPDAIRTANDIGSVWRFLVLIRKNLGSFDNQVVFFFVD